MEGGRSEASATLLPSAGPGRDSPYQPPLLEGHIVRLLELAPGARDDAVVMRLFPTELEHALDFEALSYVWGDPGVTVPVTCSGLSFGVTVNLHAALVRTRYTDRVRTLWADAICINQGHVKERSHHVAFMNLIYRRAKTVLVCMDADPDGGAADVVAADVIALLDEHALRAAQYASVQQMPVLAPDDPLLDDPRWKSLAVLMKRPWFTRAWVLQEVGVARDPQVLYGDAAAFSYRALMNLVRWMVRCASNIETRAGIFWLTIHTDWEDWLPGWRKRGAADPHYTLLDLLGHARGLLCKDPKDHIYAFLGHPLAQLEDGSGPVIQPDYEKDTRVLYLETATFLLQSASDLRVLSSVEHNYTTMAEDFPSWVFRADVEMVQNALGVWRGYYYHASPDDDDDDDVTPGPPPAAVIDGAHLRLRGIMLDVVRNTYQFSTTSEDLDRPDALRAAADRQPVSLDRVWEDIHDPNTPCSYYPGDQRRLDAFSLTLCAGLTNYEPAEDNLERHRANFAAYWRLRLQSSSSSSTTTTTGAGEPLLQEGQGGDAERFWMDMSLSSEGRSFLVTDGGLYGLGPWVARPGDLCCVLRGARVPFVLRRTGREGFYRLVGEAYAHGFMRGEVGGEKLAARDFIEETVVIC
jgi:hypothetical protein